jgi:hypothetical protein
VLVFTTLAPAVLSAQTIMALYRCRWQVELAIKRWKRRAWRCWGSRRLCQFLNLHLRVPALEHLSQFAVQGFHAGL